MPIRKIVIASGNEHKVAEFQSIFKPLGIKIVPYKDVVKADFVMPEETGTTFEENAKIKAVAIAKETGLPVFADDSGFCVKSLNDFPGLKSARFAEEVGGYPQAFAEIEKRLGGKYADAQFVCVIAFVNVTKKTDKIGDAKIFRGECNGFVTFPARGESGFGYDPIFVPNSYGVTFAEMSEDEKNSISHRAVASALFVKYIEDLKAEEEANKGRRVSAVSSSPSEVENVTGDVSVDASASEIKVKSDVKIETESVVEENLVVDNVKEDSVVFDGILNGSDDDNVVAEPSSDGVEDFVVETVAKSFQKKTEKVKTEKTGMAAFLDVDEEFDAPAVPFSSDDDAKIED